MWKLMKQNMTVKMVTVSLVKFRSSERSESSMRIAPTKTRAQHPHKTHIAFRIERMGSQATRLTASGVLADSA